VPNYPHSNVSLRIISAVIPHFGNSSSVLFLLQLSSKHNMSMASRAAQNHFCGYETSFSNAFHFIISVYTQAVNISASAGYFLKIKKKNIVFILRKERRWHTLCNRAKVAV